MGMGSSSKRRWFGGMVLFAAFAMLICGQTFLKTTLSGGVFLLYWLVCFLLTGAAVLVALLDFRALRYRIHKEQRELLETTMQKIEKEARNPKTNPQRERPK